MDKQTNYVVEQIISDYLDYKIKLLNLHLHKPYIHILYIIHTSMSDRQTNGKRICRIDVHK